MIIIKLGGSVITDKSRKDTFRSDVCQRLISEIIEAEKKVIVVHGAGSFGHILAKQYELQEGYKNQAQLKGVAEVQRDVKDLSLRVLNAFLSQGVHAVSLAPSAFLINNNRVIKQMDSGIIKRYLDVDITPITFGDVVVDESLVFSIVSGDQLVLNLAKIFRPDLVIFVTDVDGLYTGDPGSDPNARFLPLVDRKMLKNIRHTPGKVDDVTGGILGKSKIMLEIAANGMDTIILNGTLENRLRDVLTGRDVVCTKFMNME